MNIHDICLDDNLEKEKDDGNIEYKRELLNLDEETLNRRMTQMMYRIYEGLGEALYFIGVADDGTHSPTHSLTFSPTHSSTHSPTHSPTRSPTHSPTHSPTQSPTQSPT